MSNHEAVWNATAQLLKAQVSQGVWFSTFNDVVALTSDDESLRLLVPNAHVRDRIVTRYRPLVIDALDEIGESDRELIIEISDLAPDADAIVEVSDESVTTVDAQNTNNSKGNAVGLNPRYTFDNFVKGASNQFALAAALRVAETPARSHAVGGQSGLAVRLQAGVLVRAVPIGTAQRALSQSHAGWRERRLGKDRAAARKVTTLQG